jgi:hypothetical protein
MARPLRWSVIEAYRSAGTAVRGMWWPADLGATVAAVMMRLGAVVDLVAERVLNVVTALLVQAVHDDGAFSLGSESVADCNSTRQLP